MAELLKKRYHEQIADVLRREIRAEARPGLRLASDTQHAERFGVSVITVRQALHLLCQEGLVERRHGSGTYVSGSATRPRVAVVVNTAVLAGGASYFWLKLVDEVRSYLGGLGLDAQVTLGDELGLRGTAPVHGVIAIRWGAYQSWGESLAERGVPVVSNDHHYPLTVQNDTLGMVRAGTHFLMQRGRRRPMLLTLDKFHDGRPDDWLMEPFLDVLGQFGVPFHPEWAYGAVDANTAGSGWERFRALWAGGREKPDCLLVSDDTIYPEAAMAILELGIRVPDDLLVVTHANRGAGMFCPFPTVRVEFDPVASARAMVDLLRQHMARDPAAPSDIVLPFQWAGVADGDVRPEALMPPTGERKKREERQVTGTRTKTKPKRNTQRRKP